MRVALHQTSEIAVRAGRILLAERSLGTLGLVDRTPSGRSDRVERVESLSDYDVVFSDDVERSGAIAQRAALAGIACVLRSAEVPPWAGEQPMLVDATLRGAIAPALAAHEGAAIDGQVTLAWTEPGRPLRRGTAVAFPDPVGSVWAEPRQGPGGATLLAAPVGGDWAAALVMVGSTGAPDRALGVADLGTHLEAMALAAGAKAVADGRYAPGVGHAEDAADAYLLTLLDMGLEVAGFRAG